MIGIGKAETTSRSRMTKAARPTTKTAVGPLLAQHKSATKPQGQAEHAIMLCRLFLPAKGQMALWQQFAHCEPAINCRERAGAGVTICSRYLRLAPRPRVGRRHQAHRVNKSAVGDPARVGFHQFA